MLVACASQNDLVIRKGDRYAPTKSTRLGSLHFLADRRVRLGLLLPNRHELYRDPFESYLGPAFRYRLRPHLTVRYLLDITGNRAAVLGWEVFSPTAALTNRGFRRLPRPGRLSRALVLQAELSLIAVRLLGGAFSLSRECRVRCRLSSRSCPPRGPQGRVGVVEGIGAGYQGRSFSSCSG